MRKSFLILTLVLAFNIANPTGTVMSQNLIQNIEFVAEDKRKDLNKNEVLKKKIILFLRHQLLLKQVSLINSVFIFNSG